MEPGEVRWIVDGSSRQVYANPADVDALWRLAIARSDRSNPGIDQACRWVEEQLSSLALFFATVAIDAIEFGGEPCDIVQDRTDGAP